MKNSFLYGAIIVLVIAVIALGYNQYARESIQREAALAAAATEETATVPADVATTDAVATEDTTVVTDTAPAQDTAATDEAVAAETTTTDTATETAVDAAAAAAGVAVAADAVTATEAAPTADAAAAAANDQSLLAPPADLQLNVAEMMADRVLGNPAAPVTIIEYASYTCSHCAHFANTVLPEIKAQLIDTGKAKLILREFPLDKFALKASQLARCAPAERYHDLAEVLFRNQERWVKAEDPVRALKQLGSLTGMDEARMDTCMNSTELENAILTRVQDAQARHKVSSTPTFVFNDGAETFAGSQTPQRFIDAVNKLSQ